MRGGNGLVRGRIFKVKVVVIITIIIIYPECEM